MKARRAYLGLGSNLGDRKKNLRLALTKLAQVPEIKIIRCSSFYETEPVEAMGGWFLNAALALETALDPIYLWRRLQALEEEMGRLRERGQGAPRTIDLDVLLYEDWIYEDPELTIPHPAMHKRRFVLEPLKEIAPGVRHPLLGRTIEELLQELEDAHRVIQLASENRLGGQR